MSAEDPKSELVEKKLGKSLDEIIKETSTIKSGDSVGPVRNTHNKSSFRNQTFRANPYGAPGRPPVNVAYSVKVSGLPREPQNVLDPLIKAHFGKCGKVVKIVHRSAEGEAYVGFDTLAACREAFTTLNGSTLKGSTLVVERGNPTPIGGQRVLYNTNMGRPAGMMKHMQYPQPFGMPHRPFPMAQPYGMYPTHPVSLVSPYANSHEGKAHATVIVSNVPADLSAQDIQDAFSCVGRVLSADVLLNSAGIHTGRVSVTFDKRSDALEAVRRFDGGDLNSQIIRVFLE